MKTSLTADIRRGDETQVLLKLQNDGVLPDDYAAIAWHNEMRAEVVAAILKYRMFNQPEKLPERILTINEGVWKDRVITEKAIREIGDPPECPPSDDGHLWSVNLLFETGDALQTIKRNWAACVFVHGEPGTWKWDGLVLTPEGVRLRATAKPRKPGLRWSIAELGRTYRGKSVIETRSNLDSKEIMGMGQELPLIAALHPTWVRNMNGNTVPFVDAPDLEVAPDAKGPFTIPPLTSTSTAVRSGFTPATPAAAIRTTALAPSGSVLWRFDSLALDNLGFGVLHRRSFQCSLANDHPGGGSRQISASFSFSIIFYRDYETKFGCNKGGLFKQFQKFIQFIRQR